jgi:hypothetical protein
MTMIDQFKIVYRPPDVRPLSVCGYFINSDGRWEKGCIISVEEMLDADRRDIIYALFYTGGLMAAWKSKTGDILCLRNVQSEFSDGQLYKDMFEFGFYVEDIIELSKL